MSFPKFLQVEKISVIIYISFCFVLYVISNLIDFQKSIIYIIKTSIEKICKTDLTNFDYYKTFIQRIINRLFASI